MAVMLPRLLGAIVGLVVAGISAMLLVVSTANASTITFTDEAAFLAAVGPTTFENFESIPTDTTKKSIIFTDHFSVTTTPPSGGTSFLFIGPATGGPHPTDGVNALMAGSDTFDGWVLTFELNFPVFAVGFDVTDATEQPGTLSLSTNAGDLFQITSCCLANANELFFGLMNPDTAFTSFSLINTSRFDGMGVDRIHLAPIPLPAAFPLFGTGLGLLGLFGWYRRRATA